MMNDPVRKDAVISLLRLTTGEELLAEITASGTNAYQVRRPLRIVVLPGKNTSQTQVALLPWIQFTMEETMSIDKDHVMVVVPPLPEFDTQYRQVFSKIVTPAKSSLIGL